MPWKWAKHLWESFHIGPCLFCHPPHTLPMFLPRIMWSMDSTRHMAGRRKRMTFPTSSKPCNSKTIERHMTLEVQFGSFKLGIKVAPKVTKKSWPNISWVWLSYQDLRRGEVWIWGLVGWLSFFKGYHGISSRQFGAHKSGLNHSSLYFDLDGKPWKEEVVADIGPCLP